MRAKLTNHLLPARTSLLALALVCSAHSSFSSAQESDFQKNIDSTNETLITLDLQASDCLASLESDENSPALCDDFINAIDGELMAHYLEQCRILKSWRDEYVDQTVTVDLASDIENNEEMLRRLVSIEFTCGENTLRSRTQFVFTAFNRLRGGSASNGIGASTTTNSRFNTLENGERQRLQNALQNQRNRSLRESDRQFNDLENELIRQQIQNSNLPN